ncbi:hypothetical protein ACVW0K_006044 [Streptomyces filamentosus]
MASMSRELNPAVRLIAEWKKPLSSLPQKSWAPRVAGFVHSIRKVSSVPTASSATVAITVSLVCRVQFFRPVVRARLR